MRNLFNSKTLIALSAAVVFTLVSACQSAPVSGPVSTAAERPSAGEYRLGNDDQIRVTVFGHEDLSGQFNVTSNGTVSLPLIGDVSAAGLTISEFIDRTEEKLSAGYLKDPRVSAEVLNFRPYYILGEVNQPGEYPYSTDLTVLKAIATAGGYTYRANKREIMIKGLEDADERKVLLTPNTDLQPGDTVRVLERFF